MQVWLDTYAIDGINSAIAGFVFSSFTDAEQLARLNDPTQQRIVAERDGNLLGVLTLHRDALCPCDPALRHELDAVYVSRHAQRQGIGARLLARAAEMARRDGAKALWLTVWHRNARALAFYDALGWQRIGETDFVIDGTPHRNIVFRFDLQRPAEHAS